MNFLRKRNASSSEDASLRTDTLNTLRERILNNVSIGAAIAGVLTYFLVVIRSLERTPLAALIVYTLVAIWVPIIAIFRKLPYRVRAISLAGAVYALGLTSFMQGGVTTDGAIFMLTFIFMASLLLGQNGTTYSLVLAIVTIAVIAILMSTHLLLPSDPFQSDDASGWINRVFVFILVGFVVGLSLTTVLRGLETNLSRATQIASQLEKDQLDLRTYAQNMERRSTEIRTAADISRIISGVLEPQKLIQQVVDLIKERFSLYYAGVFLLDEHHRNAVLRAGTGEAGKKMIDSGHKLPVGGVSMIGWTITNRKARIALDVGQDAFRFANPYLPDTRSELALPLITGDRILGALTIQSELPRAFDEDAITVLQNIADTLAIALENARLFSELEENLREISHLHGQYLRKAWEERASLKEQAEFVLGTGQESEEKTNALDVPLTIRDQIIGQLTLEGTEEWSEEERSLIEAVATQAALALENARLLEDSQQMALRERLSADITSRIWASPNTDAIMQTAVKEIGRALRADETIIELRMD